MKIRVMVCDDNEEFVANARTHFAVSDKIDETVKEYRFLRELLSRDRTAETVKHLQLENLPAGLAWKRHGRYIHLM